VEATITAGKKDSDSAAESDSDNNAIIITTVLLKLFNFLFFEAKKVTANMKKGATLYRFACKTCR